jgi:hypothetical protein
MKRTTLLVRVGVSVLALLAVVVRKGGGMIIIANRVRVVVVMVSALAVAGGLLTLALLEKPAQAQAETITDNDRSTFDGPVASCTGEFVFIEGTMHTVSHTTIDETGVRHIKFHFSLQGVGEGASSGDKYVFHRLINQHFNRTGAPEDNFNATITETAKLMRQGSATPTSDFILKLLLHVTLNDQGEVTAEVSKFEEECT